MEVALYFPHVLVAGHTSMVRLRVANRSALALESIAITLDSRGLAGPVLGRVRRLAAGQLAHLLLEIEPERAGNFVMQAGVVAECAAQRRALRCSRALRINQPPDSNIVINIGDIQSNMGGGANAGLGADYGNVQIGNLLGGAKIKTLNDLLDLELPEEFVPLPLELDYELSAHAIAHDAATRRRPLRIPPAFLGSVQPGLHCILRAAGQSEAEIRLVSGPRFRLGRSRSDADFVAWFWPRNAQNDERTKRISKVQMELRADAGGICAWDSGSANGSLFDGQPLGRAEAGAVRLTRQAQLLLGHQYKLEVAHRPASFPAGLRIANESHWPGPAAVAPALTGCLQLTPLDTPPTPYTTVWLFSEAGFGSSRSNPLCLGDAALDEIQGRFHHHRGCFWLENGASNNAVAVNGSALQAGDIVPLTAGAQLQLGGTVYRVEISV